MILMPLFSMPPSCTQCLSLVECRDVWKGVNNLAMPCSNANVFDDLQQHVKIVYVQIVVMPLELASMLAEKKNVLTCLCR